MDKRSTQTVLPLNVEPREIKETIKQHWNITFARQGKISVVGKRIMAMVLGQIHENDLQLKPYYQMSVTDVVKAAELKGKSPYSQVKKALDELARQVWSVEDIEKQIYKPKQLINTSTMESKEGFEYGYNDGMITVVLNPFLEPYFLNLAHHSTYELKHYMHFKSWYSMRMWELLSAYRDQPKYHVSLDEFRKLMDCEKKYKDVNWMIEKTLAEPLEELKNTSLAFRVEKVPAKFHGRGRPPIVGLEFHFLKTPEAPAETLQKWAKHSERHERLLKEALEKWKLNPRHLVKHLPSVGIDALGELLRGFQLKQNEPKDRMKDIAKYCNKAFLNLAKK